MTARHVAAGFLLIALIGVVPAADPEDTETPREIENLRAFAKLYGYVRFFHPSDEAASTDWERLAIHGSRLVREAPDRDGLARTLRELFSPIAPTVQIYDPWNDTLPPLRLYSGDPAGLKTVAWQHRGVGLADARTYRSARTNRKTRIQQLGHGFGTVTQSVDAEPYRGLEVKLQAAVRAEVDGTGNQGQLWLRVDRPKRQMGFFDNMGDRPIKEEEWRSYEIVGTVADDAERIVFGCFLKGAGRAWVDEIELRVKRYDGSWEPISIVQAGFEGDDGLEGWFAGSPGYSYSIVDETPYKGEHALLIEDEAEETMVVVNLYGGSPQPGEIVDKELGAGLRARIPLALYSDEERTLGNVDADAVRRLSEALRTVDPDELTASDLGLRLGNVVIAWNVFQHFYPYFDVVDTDWDAVLTTTLAAAIDDSDPGEYLATLRKMVAELHDGHGNVTHSGIDRDRTLPGFATEWIERKAVVTATEGPGDLRVGDVILEVDGEPVDELVDALLETHSGTLQWKRVRALARLGAGPEDSLAKIKIDRDGEKIQLEVKRNRDSRIARTGPVIDKLDDGIFYVDLTRAEMSEIDARIDELAAAVGVIFDLRGYPNGNHDVIRHFIDKPVRSAIWNVPQIIYPDRERIAGWDRSGRWTLAPKEPRFEGKIAFMTDGRAISYAESFMGIIEHYRLAEVVGGPTAGANGNVNPFELPGGFRVTWTGMKVLKHDGSQHHLVGILPTHPVTRSIKGVRAGRDEVLEAALDIVSR